MDTPKPPTDLTEAGVPASWDDCEPYEPPGDEFAPPEGPPDFGGPPNEEDLPSYGPPPGAPSPPIPSDNGGLPPRGSAIKENITPGLKQLIARNKRIRNLWEGHGKTWTVTEESGEKVQLPTTSSGYDLSLICELIKRGERNKSVLATALWCRPDDAARLRGEAYITGVVGKAFRVVSGVDDAEPTDVDFTVQSFKIYDSDPSTYKLEVNGVGIRLSADELTNPGRFKKRFLQRMRRVPQVPCKPQTWEDVINKWLDDAEVIELPPEASVDTMTREIIREIIQKMPTGENLSDLDLGKIVTLDGCQAIKTRPLLRTYCESEDRISTHQLCRHLRAMGFESKTKRDGDNVERVWLRSDEVNVGGDAGGSDDWPEPGSEG